MAFSIHGLKILATYTNNKDDAAHIRGGFERGGVGRPADFYDRGGGGPVMEYHIEVFQKDEGFVPANETFFDKKMI